MELSKVIKERFSVRKFSDKMIEDEKLNEILEAGRIAPTAVNAQPQKIYVLKSEAAIKTVRALTRCAYDAPVVLMIGYDKNQQWKNPLQSGITSGEQDVSIVATHMMLKAWELGIGSCWVGYFSPKDVGEAFNIPDNIAISLLMPLGYPADDAKPAEGHIKKKNMNEIVEYV